MHELSEYRGSRVLLFGSTGFIGRWVACRLTNLGAHLSCPVRNPELASRLFALHGIQGRVVSLDLRDTDGVASLVKRLQPEFTFNLAGYGVKHGDVDVPSAWAINARFAEVLAAAVADCPTRSWERAALVHAGTAQEYGAADGDLNESTVPEPTTLYGDSKLAGTRAIEAVCRHRNLPAVVARLFTVYGQGEHDGRLLPTLIRAASHKRPIPLTAGSQRRDFTYVEDVAEGMLRLGLSRPCAGEVVNLATGRLTIVKEFIQTAAGVLGLDEARLQFGALPTRPDEMQHGEVNIARLAELVGWIPTTPVANGVARAAQVGKRLLDFARRKPVEQNAVSSGCVCL